MNKPKNIKLLGEKVNLVHWRSSKPNSIAMGIITNVLGMVVNFAPLDGHEFGVLILKCLHPM